MALKFHKMHGLGNDFVVVDCRAGQPLPGASLVAALADRRRGVGFDQLAIITPAEGAAAGLSFYNADGSPSATCGNATRCIARMLMGESGAHEVTLRTAHGLLGARDAGGWLTAVNMGAPRTGWAEIPLAEPCDTDALPIAGAPVATSMGNPHCTFFVPDVEAVDLASFGPGHEHHPLFPERTNVQVAHLSAPDTLRVRVWERGAGLTPASGSSSCAAAVAAARLGLTGRRVAVDLDGGRLVIDWREDGVWMTGPTTHVFTGVLTDSFEAGA